MILTRRFLSCGILPGILAASLLSGCASPRTLNPQVERIFKPMCTLLDDAKAMRFRVDAVADRQVETGQLVQFHRTSDVTVVRPDRLYATTESDDGNWCTWYRGKALTLLDKNANRYATDTVPGSIGEMLDQLVEKYNLVMPMADLVAGKTYESMTARVESAEDLGMSAVGDTQCHHLLFRQGNIDWQVWIQADGRPLPRKLVITYTQETDQPQYAATLDGWDLAPTVSDEIFTFTPPSGATNVSMLDLVEQDKEH